MAEAHFLPGFGGAYLYLQLVITACSYRKHTGPPSSPKLICHRKTSKTKIASDILVIEWDYHLNISYLDKLQ